MIYLGFFAKKFSGDERLPYWAMKGEHIGVYAQIVGKVLAQFGMPLIKMKRIKGEIK